MGRVIDIEPASVAQVIRTDKGRLVAVDDDVQGVAQALHEVDPSLKLSYNPDEDIWIVWEVRDGSEHLVTTALECDHRLVHQVRRVGSSDYNYADELERAEAQAEREHDHRRREQTGEIAERLAHALSRDLGRHESPRTRSSRTVVPRDL